MSETVLSQQAQDAISQAEEGKEDKNEALGALGSGSKAKKSKKKANKEKPTQVSEEELQKLIEERLRAFGQATPQEDDADWKAIKRKYKTLGKYTLETFYPGLSDEERLNKLVEVCTAIANAQGQYAENGYILSKVIPPSKHERDQLHSESSRISQIKGELEKECRDVTKHNASIKDINKKFTDDETKKREELIQNFEKTIVDVTEKMKDERVTAENFAVENTKLREELEGQIKKFEDREKEFFDQIKELDDKNKTKTEEILGKLKEIEVNAKKTFEIKDQIQQFKTRETEAKFKIAIYSQRAGDFERTLSSTTDMLKRFKVELERSGQKYRTLLTQNIDLKNKVKNVDDSILKLILWRDEFKGKMELLKKEKEDARVRLMALQTELKENKAKLEQK